MRCLCCGKELKDSVPEEEKKWGWHRRCVLRFFGTKELPALAVSDEQLTALAKETVSKGLTVPGVQKKLSLHLSTEEHSRLTIVNYPAGYILKPQTKEYASLPEFEDFAMRAAETAGIPVVPHALLRIGTEYAYITRRIDRSTENGTAVQYAMEDFCQLANRLTADKYRGSYESCARIIEQYSCRSRLDLSELFIRVIFSYIIGNSDMHLKNFSLLENAPGSREFSLSAAYDLLPVNVILPEDREQLALTMNGKKRNIHKNDILNFAVSCRLERKQALRILQKLCRDGDRYLAVLNRSCLSEDLRIKTESLIRERIGTLQRFTL